MSRHTVLIAPGVLRHQPGVFRDILLRADCHLIEPRGDDILDHEELRRHLPGVDAWIAGGESVPGALIEAAPRLRVIARVGVGYDAVDLATATRRGVAVTITPGTNHESVAEHAFALLLAVTREIARHDARIRRGEWKRNVVRPLRGSVLGLVGLGRIGAAMVPRARAFGMDVVAHDPEIPAARAEQLGVPLVSRDEILAEADFLSLHLPHRPDTERWLDRAAIARMKPRAILVNTARGGLVDEDALYEALETGRLAGAGLDVLRAEPPEARNPLLVLPNVVFTPHIAGVDTRALADMAESAARSVVAILNGSWPDDGLVNPEVRVVSGSH